MQQANLNSNRWPRITVILLENGKYNHLVLSFLKISQAFRKYQEGYSGWS